MSTSFCKIFKPGKVLMPALLLFHLVACNHSPPDALESAMILQDNFRSVTLKKHCCLYTSLQDIAIDSIVLRLQDGQAECAKLRYNDFIWLYFTLDNQSRHSNYALEINNNYLHHYELYQITDDTIRSIGKGGIAYPFHERSIENRRFIEALQIAPGQTCSYILKIDDRERETSLSLRIWNRAAFNKSEASDLLFYNLYFGGLVFIALFSLVMGTILKMRVFFAYSLYAVLMAYFMFDNLGFAYEFLYPDAPSLKRFLDTLMITPLLFSFVNFGVVYFNVKSRHPILYRYVQIFYGAQLLYLLLWAITRASWPIHYYILMNYCFVLLTFVVQIAIVVQGIKHQRTKALFFMTAVGVLLIGAVLFALSYAGRLPYEWFPTNPLLMGSVLEFGIFSLALVYEVHQINKAKNDLLLANARHQKELLAAYVEGTEKERARLSAELHDNVGSRLALLKHKVNQPTDSEELNTDLDKLYRNVRSMSHALAPHALAPHALELMGLREFLQRYLSDYRKSTDIHVNAYFDELPAGISPDLSRQVFRIVQEALQNILKYAEASLVELQLVVHEAELILTIDDDGKGFDAAAINAVASHGIHNMQSRAKALGGSFELSTSPGKGTHIVAKLPLEV
ncbi:MULTISPECIES: sensor histidine kinase [unclassified Carboxylicivirga]|uniref:sensor histidine kinase n=1 Tax=Carboxylicivirga TaxID=1628153 RepID=UPI003D332D96